MSLQHNDFPLIEIICKYLIYLKYVKKVSHHSQRAYFSDLVQLFQIQRHFGDKKKPEKEAPFPPPINHIDGPSFPQRSIEEWQALAKNNLSNLKINSQSKKRKLSALRGFYQFLKTNHKMEIETFLNFNLKTPRKIPNFLSPDEGVYLAKLCIKADLPEPKKSQTILLFFCLYGAGLRLNETCTLKKSQFNQDNSSIHIVGKGGKERLVYLPKIIEKIINKHQFKWGPYLFGKAPLPCRTGYQRIRDLGQMGRLNKPLTPHTLRHSFATQLFGSGANLRLIQTLLGHKNLNSTEIYTHLNIDDIAKSLENFHPLSGRKTSKL